MPYPQSLPLWTLFLVSLYACQSEQAKAPPTEPEAFTITAYYSGDASRIDEYPVNKLTHIIFSFCHLNGNKLVVDDESDSLAIRKLVSLKKQHPNLKVLLSLGGWGGCKTCSEVFSTELGRQAFVKSVKELQLDYGTDGIDLDWEYPAIAGYPEHAYQAEDKQNFTLLVEELRRVLGKEAELSFAAGAFDRFFVNSIDWEAVMPLVDRVNLMTYDFRHGGSDSTGHHTQLYPTPQQKVSGDYTVRYLDSIGVPKNKMVIGAAFYGRVWENVGETNRGLYQPAEYKESVLFKNMENYFAENDGFVAYWDSTAQAPYAYNAMRRLFLTYDDLQSARLKTTFAKRQGLNGIMFWRLGGDKAHAGLLEEIFKSSQSK